MKNLILAFAATAAFGLLAEDKTVSEDWVLDDDYVVDALTVNEGATITLNGHSLEVKSLAGTGTIWDGLPADYVQLEYIESTRYQYIDTGISPYSAAKIEADVAYEGDANGKMWDALICASANDNSSTEIAKCYGVWIWNNGGNGNNRWSVMYNGKTYISSAIVSRGTKCKIVADWSTASRTLSVDETSKLNDTTAISNPTELSHTMYLPAWNSAETVRNAAPFKIYSFKIYNPQTTLVRNYIPAKRASDNAIGLYDKVSGEFFQSATETAFKGGESGVGECSGGELRINVDSGVVTTNSTVALSGTMKVVKTGAGTYASAKQQLYTGGTFVSEGRIVRSHALDASVYCVFGKWGTEVFVASNAQVVVEGGKKKNGYQTLNGYKVTIAGDGPDGKGAIYGKEENGDYNGMFIGGLSLSGDALITAVKADCFNLNNNRSTINIALNGHTLTMGGSGRIIAWSANVIDEGRVIVDVAPGNAGNPNCLYTLGNGVNAPLADFEVAQGGALGGESPMTVSNLVMRGAYYPLKNNRSYFVTVLGCYSPKATCGGWPKVKLGDETHLAPTLDLSDLASAYDGTSRGIEFVSGATVTVNVGDRDVKPGDKLVTWSQKPDEATSFVLVKNGEPADTKHLVAEDGGLYFKVRGLIIMFR